MDDNNRNLILAMVLSALVLIGWYAFFAPPPPVATAPAADTTAAQTATTPAAPAPQAGATPALIGAADDPVLGLGVGAGVRHGDALRGKLSTAIAQLQQDGTWDAITARYPNLKGTIEKGR